jgi:hypothetical protein
MKWKNSQVSLRPMKIAHHESRTSIPKYCSLRFNSNNQHTKQFFSPKYTSKKRFLKNQIQSVVRSRRKEGKLLVKKSKGTQSPSYAETSRQKGSFFK